MFRFVAVILSLSVAAPAVVHASFEHLQGVDLVGPDECCCPEQANEDAAPRIEQACCCELGTAQPSVPELERTADLSKRVSLDVPPAVLSVDLDRTWRAQLSALPAPSARAPPITNTLLAQQTSLLL